MRRKRIGRIGPIGGFCNAEILPSDTRHTVPSTSRCRCLPHDRFFKRFPNVRCASIMSARSGGGVKSDWAPLAVTRLISRAERSATACHASARACVAPSKATQSVILSSVSETAGLYIRQQTARGIRSNSARC